MERLSIEQRMTLNCIFCKVRLPPDRLKCLACHEWQPTDDSTTDATLARQDASVLLANVVSSDMDRLQTGDWDECWGTNYKTGKQGIARCSVTLLSGSPGAGKSTLILQIADAAVLATNAEALYLAGEEPLEQIKARADRMGIVWTGRIRLLSLMSGEGSVDDLLNHYKPGFLVLDSLTSIAGKDAEKAVAIARAVKLFAMRYRVAAILTCQVTKSGDFAGLEKLQHEVDCTMQFFPDEGIEVPEDSERIRELSVLKNRNGRAYISNHFAMTEKGLIKVVIPRDEPDEDQQDEEEDEEEP